MNTLTLLSWAIAAGGLLCFLIWNKLISDADKLRELKRFRSKEAGVADLLNYAAMVDDGVIACKSGALMAAWLYTGKDDAQKTEAERDQTAALLNRALLSLDDGWMIHIDNVRHEAP
ncbi:MAG: conjugal transfer protein TrbE, partial [Bilophila wadsworthia]